MPTGNKNESSSSTSSSTANYDNRIANDSGLVVGQGANYAPVTTISPEVTSLVSKVLDFSGGVASSAAAVVNEAQANQKATETALIQTSGNVASAAQLGNASLLSQLTPVLVIGAIGLVIFMGFRKR